MNDNNKDMFDFPSVSEEAWMSAINKELKGADISTIRKEIEKDITLEPFYVQDKGNVEVLEMTPSEESIAIAEVFDLNLPISLEHLKVSLEGGCDSPEFIFSELSQLEGAFDILNLSYVFSTYRCELDEAESLINFIARKDTNASGAILIPYNFENKFWMARQSCLDQLPNFKFGQISHQAHDARTEQIFQLAAIFESYLHDGLVRGNDLSDLVRSVIIEWKIGNDFLIECSAIRGLQHILSNILESLDYKEGSLPYIQVRTAESSLTSDTHINMIRLTTQALISNFTRVDRIILAPGKINSSEVNNFDRRITRNIQHLLILETKLEKQQDALNGSYFFDTLSFKMAEKVWDRLEWKEK